MSTKEKYKKKAALRDKRHKEKLEEYKVGTKSREKIESKNSNPYEEWVKSLIKIDNPLHKKYLFLVQSENRIYISKELFFKKSLFKNIEEINKKIKDVNLNLSVRVSGKLFYEGFEEIYFKIKDCDTSFKADMTFILLNNSLGKKLNVEELNIGEIIGWTIEDSQFLDAI